jgi:putative transposase
MLEKRPASDLSCAKFGFAAQRLMELEIANLTGAGNGEKSASWLAQHNGSVGCANS